LWAKNVPHGEERRVQWWQDNEGSLMQHVLLFIVRFISLIGIAALLMYLAAPNEMIQVVKNNFRGNIILSVGQLLFLLILVSVVFFYLYMMARKFKNELEYQSDFRSFLQESVDDESILTRLASLARELQIAFDNERMYVEKLSNTSDEFSKEIKQTKSDLKHVRARIVLLKKKFWTQHKWATYCGVQVFGTWKEHLEWREGEDPR
jgi:hypothetical protein